MKTTSSTIRIESGDDLAVIYLDKPPVNAIDGGSIIGKAIHNKTVCARRNDVLDI